MADNGLSEFDRVSARLRAMGLTLRALPGEYLINCRGGADDAARIAADLREVIVVAEAMISAAAASSEADQYHRHPLSSAKRYRRRFIRRHNKWFRTRSLRRRHRD